MKKAVWGLIGALLMAGSVYAAEDVTGKDVFSVIHSRKSVRHFTGAAVSRADLEKIVRAGMAAPTAGNMQPWSFIVVTDRKTLDDLAAGLLNARMLAKAGAAIVVCTEEAKANAKKRDLAISDASVAGQNILLAVEGLGLGGVWTAANPYEDRVKVSTRASFRWCSMPRCIASTWSMRRTSIGPPWGPRRHRWDRPSKTSPAWPRPRWSVLPINT